WPIWMVARSSTLSSVYDIGAAPYRKGQVLHSVFAAAIGRSILAVFYAFFLSGLQALRHSPSQIFFLPYNFLISQANFSLSDAD
ncbi:hypothetical protein ACRCQ0_33190, partial [Pseudomonas aeruginosa]